MGCVADTTDIIIADDDPLIRSVLRSKLENLGLTVFLAADGQEAIGYAMRTRASLILLDFNMPRMNGLAACMRIRALPYNADTTIVALTAMDVDNVQVAAMRAGVDLFLRKPIGIAQLLGKMAPFLPVDVATRRAITNSAARAGQIAEMAPTTVATKVASKGNNPLERGKRILSVLRG